MILALIAGGVVGPVLLLFGLRGSSADAVSIWLALETVFTALIGRVFFREHFGLRTMAALVCVVIASVVSANPSSGALAPAALLVAGACLAWAIDNNLVATLEGISPARWTLLKGAVAGATNLAIGIVVERPALHYTWALALVLGAVSYGLSLVLYVASSQQIGAVRSQLVFATAPFFGVAIAWAFLAEAPGIWVGAGALLLIVALVLMPRDRHGHAHRHAAITHAHWHRHGDGHHEHGHGRMPLLGWHYHEHAHEALEHEHAHAPDLHHRHAHEK